MSRKNKFTLLSILLTLLSCGKDRQISNPLELVLGSQNQNIKRVMDSIDQFEVQIRYTQIDRRNDSVFFTDYDFQVDDTNYFYPASTVKLPSVVSTLEKLNKIDTLDRHTRFYVEGDSLETTFSETISAIFTVSDNNANNRLVEFLGQDAINKGLLEKGVAPIRIAHRLGYHSDDTATKPLVIYMNDSTTAIFKGTVNTYPKPLQLNKIRKGSGFHEDDSLMQEPFDFSLKNYYPISTQQGLLKRIIFPEKFSIKERFDITESQREFLMKAMHTLPKNAGYDPKVYYDGICKFLMYGDTKENIPDHIKIYNKIGGAYGTLTDCAYIVDTKNNVDFMVTATILINKNKIFNDDIYEYDTIGIPFLAQLGRELYAFELQRKK